MNSDEACPPAVGVTIFAAVSRSWRHLFLGKTRSWRHLFGGLELVEDSIQ
jgi:hypothetical protein